MRYASRADLAARFGAGEMDDLAPLDGAASPRADAALDDASAEIDAAISETYTLPLAGSWPSLTAICCDLARAMLYDDDAPERVLGALSSARKRLREIAAGARRLVNDAGVEAPRRPSVFIARTEPVFTDAALADYLHPTHPEILPS